MSFSIATRNCNRPQVGGRHPPEVHSGRCAQRAEGFAQPTGDLRERYGRVDLQPTEDRRICADTAESGIEELLAHVCRHL